MRSRSPARLAKLLSDVVLIDKARLAVLAAELADVAEGHALAAEALSVQKLHVPLALAVLSYPAMERRLVSASTEVSQAAAKLLADGCQQRYFERRAASVTALEETINERDRLADIIERLTISDGPH